MDVEKILTEGVFFKKAKSPKAAEEKVKTKAKKKTYITGLHGSGAAKMKADIRKKRANRHKGKRSPTPKRFFKTPRRFASNASTFF